MGRVFPFVRKKKEQYGFFVFFLTLALFGLAVYLTFWVHWPLAFAVAWAAMMANIIKSYPDVLDSRREVWMRRLNFWIGLAGGTVTFLCSLLILVGDTLTGKAFPITWHLSDINLENKIFLAAVILVYFLFLCGALSGRRAASEEIRKAKRSAVKMEGPDGKQYLMPGDAKTAWRIYRKSSSLDDTAGSTGIGLYDNIPLALLGQRLADLMYGDFKQGKRVLEEKPVDTFDDEAWKKADHRKFWDSYAFLMHAEAAMFWEENGQYETAKEYADRLTEIFLDLLDRGVDASYHRWDMVDIARVRELVYYHFPDSARDQAVEQRCKALLKEAQEKRAAEAKEQRQSEADAPKRAEERRLEEEERQLKQQMRAEKERKLRAEYEAKMKRLDDQERTLNAFLDKNTYTNEENYLAGNLGTQEYSRRKFLRDEQADKYRKEYEDALRALDDEEE